LYLDRTHVMKNTSGDRSLWDMGLNLFRKTVIQTQEIEQKTITGLLHLIKLERYVE
jgi:cullin-4